MVDAAIRGGLPTGNGSAAARRGTIAMVAGEASGDLLASLMMGGLKARLGDTMAYAGIGGKRMMEADRFVSWSAGAGEACLGVRKPFDADKANVLRFTG